MKDQIKKIRDYAPRGGNSCSVDGCHEKYYARGFCKRHHQWHWVRGLLPDIKTTAIKDKLLSNIIKDVETGCWEWQMGRNHAGYGRISIGGGKGGFAHRVAYEEFVGPIPEHMEVCHKCDNPPCCNPDHLFVGTHRDNMIDAHRKGRLPEFSVSSGPDHPRSLFTADQVRSIRRDPRPIRRIAAEHGCNPETIKRVQEWETYSETTCSCSDGLPWMDEQ